MKKKKHQLFIAFKSTFLTPFFWANSLWFWFCGVFGTRLQLQLRQQQQQQL